MTTGDANEDMAEHWAHASSMWVDNMRLMDNVMAGVTKVLSDALTIGPGDVVLDVGCGTGTLSSMAADRGAQVVGVDIAAPMVETARSRVPGATFLAADVQTADLSSVAPTGGFTAAMSRFGVMFFDDPVAAFSNIHSVVAPDGRLAFACWRPADENPMFSLGTSVLVDHMDPRPPTSPPGAPGPLSLADVGRTTEILARGGWIDVDITPADVVCDYALDGDDGVENRLAMILGTIAGRDARAQLEPLLGEQGWVDLLDEVRDGCAATW